MFLKGFLTLLPYKRKAIFSLWFKPVLPDLRKQRKKAVVFPWCYTRSGSHPQTQIFEFLCYQHRNESAAVRSYKSVIFKLFMFIIIVILCALRHGVIWHCLSWRFTDSALAVRVHVFWRRCGFVEGSEGRDLWF